MSVDNVCSLVLAILSALSLIFAVWQTIQKKKQGANNKETAKELQSQLEEHNKRVAVFNKIAKVINETEHVFQGIKNSAAKLNYAITKLQIDCVEQNVVIPEEELAAEVEKYLSTPQKKEN